MNFRSIHTRMPTSIRFIVLCFIPLYAVLLLSGCNRDPKKFVAKGDQSFAEGKLPDAMIFYGRALQLDPRMAEAHYKLAQTHLKMKSWSSAYVELRRVVELQPDNWQAQLDLKSSPAFPTQSY